MAVHGNEIKRAEVEIKLEHLSADIKIDGQKINGVKQFWISAGVDRCPSLLLEIVPSKINFKTDGTMLVKNVNIDDLSAEELLKLISEKMFDRLNLK